MFLSLFAYYEGRCTRAIVYTSSKQSAEQTISVYLIKLAYLLVF